MSRNLFFKMWLVFGIMILSVGSVAAQQPTVQLQQKEGLGAYLTDGKGMTLYYFAKDTPGKSVCKGDCLTKWPPLMAGKVTVGTGLVLKDFGELAADGGKQVTFRGYPLYYFFKDAKPGDTNGQGVGGVWFVIDPQAFAPGK